MYHGVPARSYHIAFHAYRAIPYTICDARHALSYAMPTVSCRIPCHSRPAIPYDMPCIAKPCHIPCYASPEHTLYHVMPAMPYHIPCHARQAIQYTIPCIVRPYHILCYARQAIPFPMPCPPGHTMHAQQAIPYTVPCHQAIPYTMPCQPGHTIYHAIPRQAIAYIMPCPPGHTIYLTMPATSYHTPCHATANDYFGKSCRLSKGANGNVTRCTIYCDDFGLSFAFPSQLSSCENKPG